MVITTLDTGGAERYLLRTLQHLKSAPISAMVLCLGEKGSIGDEIERLGISVVYAQLKTARSRQAKIKSKSLRCCPRAFWKAITFKPNVVHAWMYHAILCSSLFKMIFPKTQWIWSIRNPSVASANLPKLTIWIIKSLTHLSAWPNHIIYNSLCAQQSHEKIGYNKQRSLVIHNGFNIPKTKQVPRNERRSTLYDKLDAPTLLYISRYHPQKDPTLFCQTLSIVHQRFPELKCYAFGEGLNTHQPQWQRLLQEYSLAHIVSSMGVSDNLEPWMSSANALILTSAEESFPNVIGEAMALGTPIVSTSVGDIPHLCGELGFLSPAGDPDLLAKKCIEALSLSHVDRIQLAQKQQLRIQNLFNLERQHQTLEKLYLRKPSRQS